MPCIFGNSSLLLPQHLSHVILCVFVVMVLEYFHYVFGFTFACCFGQDAEYECFLSA